MGFHQIFGRASPMPNWRGFAMQSDDMDWQAQCGKTAYYFNSEFCLSLGKILLWKTSFLEYNFLARSDA